MRTHEQVKEFAKQDIINLVQNTDLSDLNTFLVLNGRIDTTCDSM